MKSSIAILFIIGCVAYASGDADTDTDTDGTIKRTIQHTDTTNTNTNTGSKLKALILQVKDYKSQLQSAGQSGDKKLSITIIGELKLCLGKILSCLPENSQAYTHCLTAINKIEGVKNDLTSGTISAEDAYHRTNNCLGGIIGLVKHLLSGLVGTVTNLVGGSTNDKECQGKGGLVSDAVKML